jgi:hypothetical protein
MTGPGVFHNRRTGLMAEHGQVQIQSYGMLVRRDACTM